MKFIPIILLIALACSAGVSYAQTFEDGILILREYDELPASAKRVGSIRVIDGGLKIRCGYDRTMQQAREKARDAGGNVMKITKLKEPDAWSTCYRIWADVYHMDNIHEYKENGIAYTTKKERAIDSALSVLLPDTASYALLFVYRQPSPLGSMVRYNLHVDDSVVCRVKNGSKYMIKLYNTGTTKIWARTEGRDEVDVDVAPGKVCFLRCGVSMGAFVEHPTLEIMSAYEGLPEYDDIEYEPADNTEDEIYR